MLREGDESRRCRHCRQLRARICVVGQQAQDARASIPNLQGAK
jgi:hypothetical protein